MIKDKQEAEMDVYETPEEKRSEAVRIFREQYELGKPIEEIVEEYISKETGWDRLKEFYGYYEGYVLRRVHTVRFVFASSGWFGAGDVVVILQCEDFY